jgi:hypothetical protein
MEAHADTILAMAQLHAFLTAQTEDDHHRVGESTRVTRGGARLWSSLDNPGGIEWAEPVRSPPGRACRMAYNSATGIVLNESALRAPAFTNRAPTAGHTDNLLAGLDDLLVERRLRQTQIHGRRECRRRPESSF